MTIRTRAEIKLIEEFSNTAYDKVRVIAENIDALIALYNYYVGGAQGELKIDWGNIEGDMASQTDLNTSLINLNNSIISVQEDLDAAEITLSNLSGTVDGNISDITALQEAMLTQQGYVTILQSNVTSIFQQLSSDSDRMDSIESNIDDIELAISGINDTLTTIQNLINDKQDTLVSGTNIKTINGESILGSGDIVIDSGSSAAVDVSYDNTSSGLTATNVQNAIDEVAGAGGGGATTLLGLTDTPSAYGTAGQVLKVNSSADGVEWALDETSSGASTDDAELLIWNGI